MANIPSTLPGYNGQTTAPDANYPYGSARNDSAPGDLTGTPRIAAEINDIMGFHQAILVESGIVPSGSPDTAIASQYLQGLKKIFKTEADVKVTIPTNFPDLQSAFDEYSTLQVFAKANVTIEVEIETGHLLTGGLNLLNGDFSNFFITSVDPTVKLAPGFVGITIVEPDYIPGETIAYPASLFYGFNCVMPELRCLIDMENNHGEGMFIINGRAFILTGCGVINAGRRGLNARNSQVFGAGSQWQGALSTGFRAQLGTIANMGAANMDDCCQTFEQSNGAVYISRGCGIELRNATFKNSGGKGIVVRRSIVSAGDTDATGSADIAYTSTACSKVDVIDSFAGGTSPAVVLYQCEFNSEMACDGAEITTPADFNRVFRIRGGGKMTMNLGTLIDAVEVTRASIFLDIGSPRFDFNLATGYGLVFKENEASSFDAQVAGVWTVNYLPAGRYEAHTTSQVIIDIVVASGAFSSQLTPPPPDASFLSVESYSLEVDGRTSAGGGGNRIFVNHCVGNAYNTNEFKVQNTGQRLDSGSGGLGINSIAVRAIIRGVWAAPATLRGSHTGSDNAAVLTDSGQLWPTNSLIGRTLTNVTDGSTTTITANTSNTITGVLAGGTDDDWDKDDVYTIS